MPEIKCAYDEMVDVGKLIPNPRNPNKHPKKQIEMLARIIEAQGWRAPITVSNRSGFIVRGHCRLEAALFKEWTDIPVDLQDYVSEAEEWADLIADNKIAEFAEMDEDILMALLREFDPSMLDLTGIDGVMNRLKPMEIIEPLGNLGGTNYGDSSSNKIPINILGIGGMVDRGMLEKVRDKLISLGADKDGDNGELLGELFISWVDL